MGWTSPTELEPEQGSLDLASPEDAWTAADWEQQAAAVLRKARRLSDDDPDDLVWEKLTRTTLDGIAVTPLGTRACSTTSRPAAGRPAPGDWDIRAYVDGRDAKLANEEALVDLDGGVTSLWLRVDADTDLAALLDGVLLDLAPVVLDGGDPAAFLGVRSRAASCTPTPTSASRPPTPPPSCAQAAQKAEVRGFVVDATDGPRPRRLRRPGARLVDGRRARRTSAP